MILRISDKNVDSFRIVSNTAVYFPWHENSDFLLGFEAYIDHTSDEPDNSVSIYGYNVSNCAGYVVAIANRVPLPAGLYRSPQDLLERLFPDFAHSLKPPELIFHPLIHTIPVGSLGAGLIVVRNVRERVSNRRGYIHPEEFNRLNVDRIKLRWRELEKMGFSPHIHIEYEDVTDLVTSHYRPPSLRNPKIIDGKQVYKVKIKLNRSKKFISKLEKLTGLDKRELNHICQNNGILAQDLRRHEAKNMVAKIESFGGHAYIEE